MHSNERVDKIKTFYHIMDQWLTLYEERRTIGDILIANGYLTIAIYGMGTMGVHLIESLKKSKVKIKYVIDSSVAVYCNGVTTKTLEDCMDVVDAVIYTNPNEKVEVIKEINEKFSCKVISLEDVVFDNLGV